MGCGSSKSSVEQGTVPAPKKELDEHAVEQADGGQSPAVSVHHGAADDIAQHYEQPIGNFYIFGSLLGKGSFAEVYDATRKSDGAELAIKAIDTRASNFEPEDLDIEIKVLMKVNHPNIIKLYEVFESEDHFYMVLEKVDGGELFDHIIERGHYSEATAATIMKQLLSALSHMHSLNLVHRDLKPENLLYHEDANGDITIKIADFGLSAVIDHDKLLTVACGSPGYVAPEILLQRRYNEAVDTWSAGVIMFILLSGLTPFGGNTDRELYRAIVSADYSFDGREWAGISDSAKDLISKMLQVNPSKRITPAKALKHSWITSDAPDTHLANLVLSIMNWQQGNGRQIVHAKLLKWASSAKASVQSRSRQASRSQTVSRSRSHSPSSVSRTTLQPGHAPGAHRRKKRVRKHT
ncbi:CAMK/CAMK1 protein kinase [Thecamonas trahens ATCC 50062]|uniref:CAMK/CAMK1 protein kinase n=1 Tax=Thecamonas trahens ATCC 50062 TaxID=461836 RepID=A0A0L0DMW9_THETB|nr:CAMK/CAMK1 protein kinase [Thecamonas trahens ATCC 50062]KNC53649.1 CAMK/CAMK1 protein kinase [Thecamonas trahens ATCC 50062]|eukprot:XP_013761964.1 CAMK/CAMK1 protein kinase [Thecamonas trahens ATCC 50062]